MKKTVVSFPLIGSSLHAQRYYDEQTLGHVYHHGRVLSVRPLEVVEVSPAGRVLYLDELTTKATNPYFLVMCLLAGLENLEGENTLLFSGRKDDKYVQKVRHVYSRDNTAWLEVDDQEELVKLNQADWKLLKGACEEFLNK